MNKYRVTKKDETKKRTILTIEEYITFGFFKSIFSGKKEEVLREFELKFTAKTNLLRSYPEGRPVTNQAVINCVILETGISL